MTVGRAPDHPEAYEGPSEEAEPDCPGEGQPEERTQQGHPCPQQAGEPVQGAAETQPHTQGTQSTSTGGFLLRQRKQYDDSTPHPPLLRDTQSINLNHQLESQMAYVVLHDLS